tara:strand:+ start:1905 stop:2195 length:291 start_codon:yes stop_codon:yes gene_type:complete
MQREHKMINDNPARVATPESPVEPDLKKLKYDFLDVYLDTDNTDSAFHEALEEYICVNGLIHHWLRQLYTRDRDEVVLDMDDLLKSFISNYIEDMI